MTSTDKGKEPDLGGSSGTHKDKEDSRMLKNQSHRNDFDLVLDNRSCHSDRRGVNGLSNRAHMQKIELFKV